MSRDLVHVEEELKGQEGTDQFGEGEKKKTTKICGHNDVWLEFCGVTWMSNNEASPTFEVLNQEFVCY